MGARRLVDVSVARDACANLHVMTPRRHVTPALPRIATARRAGWTMAGLVLSGLVLAACGDRAADRAGGGAAGASLTPQRLALIADRTSSRGGLRMSMHQTMTVPGLGTVPSTAEGRFDTTSRRGEMTLSMDVPSPPDGTGAGTGMTAAVSQRMIFDGLTIYMSAPQSAATLPGGKRWMKIDLGAVGRWAGLDLGALARSGGQDPTQVLRYLKATGGDVTRVGSDTVRGVATTHYVATVDLRKVPASAPAAERAAVRRSIEQVVKLAGTSTAPIEVWVDAGGLARRIATTITTGTAGERVTLRQRIDLYGFGTTVDVAVPPASEVVDVGDLGAPGAAAPDAAPLLG
jgi:hypothetical protein